MYRFRNFSVVLQLFIIGASVMTTNVSLKAESRKEPMLANARHAVLFMGYMNRQSGESLFFVSAAHFPTIDSIQITCIKYNFGTSPIPNQVTLVLEDAGDSNRIIGQYVFLLAGEHIFKIPSPLYARGFDNST